MNITLSVRAEKQLRKLSKLDQIAVAKKIRSIRNSVRNLHTEKLKGYTDIYRVRVGNYRIVYRKRQGELFVVLIGHRRDIYKLVAKLVK